MWLVLVKIYGRRPKKLLNKIKVKRDKNINVVPLNLEIPKRVLNSLCKVEKILFQNINTRVGINQNIVGKNKIPRNVLNQFNEKLKIFVEGSKIENKFIIIFNLIKNIYYLYFYLNFLFFYYLKN
jgi:hypothetical protein